MKDFASFGMGSPVSASVERSPSYIISDIREDILSFELKGLKVFGPSPIVEARSSPPNLPIGACD